VTLSFPKSLTSPKHKNIHFLVQPAKQHVLTRIIIWIQIIVTEDNVLQSIEIFYLKYQLYDPIPLFLVYERLNSDSIYFETHVGGVLAGEEAKNEIADCVELVGGCSMRSDQFFVDHRRRYN
jgi:hypothetical protein